METWKLWIRDETPCLRYSIMTHCEWIMTFKIKSFLSDYVLSILKSLDKLLQNIFLIQVKMPSLQPSLDPISQNPNNSQQFFPLLNHLLCIKLRERTLILKQDPTTWIANRWVRWRHLRFGFDILGWRLHEHMVVLNIHFEHDGNCHKLGQF